MLREKHQQCGQGRDAGQGRAQASPTLRMVNSTIKNADIAARAKASRR